MGRGGGKVFEILGRRSLSGLIFIFIFSILDASSAFATTGTTTARRTNEFIAPGTNVFSASLQFQNSQYVSAGEAYFRQGAERENVGFRLFVADDWRLSKRVTARAVANNELSMTERWNYLDINELNVNVAMGGHQLTVGRKLETWADWESTWQQGVFQPRYMQNRLHPDVVGLTGVFYTTPSSGPLKATLGFLPIFIPEFGAHYTIENDRFVSKNPWFHTPASEFLYNGQRGTLRYSVDQPSNSEILNHPGGVAKAEYRARNYFSRVSAAYKPIAQLAMGFPSNNQVDLSGDMNIVIHPRVVYDRVISNDHQYNLGPWTLSGSVAYDNPENNPGPSEWTRQEFAPAWIFSALVSRRLEDIGPRAARVQLGLLKVNGGDDLDRGAFATDVTKFERRFQYYEAYLLAVKSDLRFGFNNPLENELRLIYDRMQNGGVVSFLSGLRINPNWRADLQLDFLGLLSRRPATVSDGFLSTYRANDRVALGMSYVF